MGEAPEPPASSSPSLPKVTPIFPQPKCGGIALIDYDGEGKLDVFFTAASSPTTPAPTPPTTAACCAARPRRAPVS
jgi:hypothetical protein